MIELKVCTECGIAKPLSRYKFQAGNYLKRCRDCRNASQREYFEKYRIENRDALLERARKWRAAHKKPRKPKPYPVVNGKKECSRCRMFLDVKEFYPTKKYYSRKCRKCTREYLLHLVGEKECPKCNKIKSYSDFRPNKEWYDRFCKPCRNIIQNEKYHTDSQFRNKHKESSSASAKKHRAKRTESFRKWKQRNPDKVLKIRLAYMRKHKINNRKYIEANKEKISAKNKEWRTKICHDLDDKYITYYLRSKIGIREIPAPLIKLKRLQILAKRTIKLKHNEPQTTSRPNVPSA